MASGDCPPDVGSIPTASTIPLEGDCLSACFRPVYPDRSGARSGTSGDILAFSLPHTIGLLTQSLACSGSTNRAFRGLCL